MFKKSPSLNSSFIFALYLISVGLSVFAASSSHATTQGLYQEANPGRYGKVYAISDVHGMYDNLVALLQTADILDQDNNWSGGNSLLIIVGDSIDKGPNSLEVLNLWNQLISQAPKVGGKVLHLLGNHEAELLAGPTDDKKAVELRQELTAAPGKPSVVQFLNSTSSTGALIRSMPVAAVIGKWLFVHAGYLQSQSLSQFSNESTTQLSQLANNESSPLISDNSILEAKGWWVVGSESRSQLEQNLDQNGLNGVVFGHQPGALLVKGADGISTDGRLIKIDNGMAPQAGSHPGSLLVFENPSEMNQALVQPHVQTIQSGNSKPQDLQLETAGADLDLTSDD